jgi:hypothetical protein
MRKLTSVLFIFISLFLLQNCGSNENKENKEHGSVIGKWVGEDAEGTLQTFIFYDKGRANWYIQSKQIVTQFDIQYSVDYSKKPYKINLYDFKEGPLKGKTLYGIFEFPDSNSIRLDVEPGSEESGGDKVRPSEFDEEQTMTYYKTQTGVEKPSKTEPADPPK